MKQFFGRAGQRAWYARVDPRKLFWFMLRDAPTTLKELISRTTLRCLSLAPLMRYRFQFRRYRLAFRGVVRTAHGPWGEREGVVVRIEDEQSRTGYGEAAPIPWFGTESVDDAEEACRDLGEWVEDETLDAVPQRFARALEEAGKLATPEAVRVTIPGAIIKTSAELDQWLGGVRKQVEDKLKDGPVIV